MAKVAATEKKLKAEIGKLEAERVRLAGLPTVVSISEQLQAARAELRRIEDERQEAEGIRRIEAALAAVRAQEPIVVQAAVALDGAVKNYLEKVKVLTGLGGALPGIIPGELVQILAATLSYWRGMRPELLGLPPRLSVREEAILEQRASIKRGGERIEELKAMGADLRLSPDARAQAKRRIADVESAIKAAKERVRWLESGEPGPVPAPRVIPEIREDRQVRYM